MISVAGYKPGQYFQSLENNVFFLFFFDQAKSVCQWVCLFQAFTIQRLLLWQNYLNQEAEFSQYVPIFYGINMLDLGLPT